MDQAFFRRLENALRSVRRKTRVTPSLAIITGSGLGGFLDAIDGLSIPYDRIASFPRSSVKGHPGILKVNGETAVMGGRFHLYEAKNPDDVILPVFLLYKLGVKKLILTNAAGGINPCYNPGDMVLIRDHINLTGHNPLRGRHVAEYGPRFPDMSDCYARALRADAVKRFPELSEGVYAGMLGPSYETPAEIEMLQRLGADMVGMSTVPEAIAARFLGLEVLGISLITNRAGGRAEAGITHDEVIAVGAQASQKLTRILSSFVADAMGKKTDGNR